MWLEQAYHLALACRFGAQPVLHSLQRRTAFVAIAIRKGDHHAAKRPLRWLAIHSLESRDRLPHCGEDPFFIARVIRAHDCKAGSDGYRSVGTNRAIAPEIRMRTHQIGAHPIGDALRGIAEFPAGVGEGRQRT